MVQESLGPSISSVGEAMGGAESDLGVGRARSALQREQTALQALRGMREQMQQLTQRQRQREQRRSGAQRSAEDVEIPAEGRSNRGDFRRRVIESMREASIESYEQEIRQYYERLLE